MTIKAILAAKPVAIISIHPSVKVTEAIALLAEKRIGALPVVEDSLVKGIFSERDVIYGLARAGAAFLNENVGAVMTSPALTVSSESNVMAALSLMTMRRVRHLPVVDGNTLLGFISIGDLVKYRIDKIEAEAAAMRDYIQGA
ncbi:MAG: CBS domain-containing protein [Alphaproteobacteria bacterium]|nr:CBS domain-containing protein [Alphaproteobacteria bacterium]MDE2041466.1 CBS domain-containing protein [Alphaproteobacteria bacterium]MDE2340953.1 CBS domain-containing protein [Alphaproteobacteria bacterium]